MKIILLSVSNINSNYQDYKLDFEHNSFLHYAEKMIIF